MKRFKEFLEEEQSAMSSTPETIETNKQPPVSKLTVANKQQLRQNPMKPGDPFEMEDRQTPEEKWDDVFSRDNFYEIWKKWWEELYGKGYTNQKERDAEFERIIDLMRRKFIKSVNGIGQGEAFNDAIRFFQSYFEQPTEA
jgi:mRNA degradation ribonuclease J1/J2